MALNRKISSLLLVTFLDHLSINIVLPALVFVFFDTASNLFPSNTPESVRSHWYGLTTSLPYFAALLTTPLLSALSDNYGRKIILVVASLGALFFAACCGFSILTGLIAIMLLGKFTGGLCARSEPTALAAMVDISDAKHKVINVGYLQVVIAFGAFIGPIIGGQIAKYNFSELNFSSPFWLAALIAVFSTLAAAFMFQETYTPKIATSPYHLKQIYQELWSTDIRRITIVLILFQIAWSTYYQFFPPVLKQYFNFGPKMIGWFVGLIAAWITLTSLFGMRILKKYFHDQQILRICTYIMLGGFSLTFSGLIDPSNSICRSIIWLGAILIPAGDVAAYCVIVAMLSEAVSPSHQGKAMGLCFLLVYLVWGLTSLVAGVLGGIHITLPILIAPLALLGLLMITKSKNN